MFTVLTYNVDNECFTMFIVTMFVDCSTGGRWHTTTQ